ncbi:MAG: hypothetical protein NTX50_03740 [Candidatus Sumerlaeota bacterium]|nr:hypothetical protein [Candidatus Sumerlaeota bacterium]
MQEIITEGDRTMMPGKTIPKEVKQEAERIVAQFNQNEFGQCELPRYVPSFRGQYLYLHRDDGFGPRPICRLSYTGDMVGWKFAIYKYSSEAYDPDECWFPGFELLDGTIESAMRAGLMAYD